ncbi:MAG: HAMP domain-containing protein [Myxococcales bacterium]|nr:HAMP domain-containing protein [Myxococcales bacterium]
MSPSADAPTPPPAPAEPPPAAGRRGLFWRIYVSSLLTVAAFAIVVGLAVFAVARSYGPDWVENLVDAVEEREAELLASLDDPARRHDVAAALGRELGVKLELHDHVDRFLRQQRPRGRKPGTRRKFHRKLERGQPIVRQRGSFTPPLILLGLLDERTGTLRAVAVIDAQRPGARWQYALAAVLALAVFLAAGTWPLARALSQRLAALERGAERIASGELTHRIPIDAPQPRDEIDRLGHAFNDMAGRLDALIRGQRTLLANVSHELRTPVARMRVLVELLGDRVERDLTKKPEAAGDPTLTRVRDGLRELDDDLEEMGALISDLLTSGKLELAAGEASELETQTLDLAPVLTRLAGKVGARVDCEPDLELDADATLLERLLSNLLSNARRACPDGEIVVLARRHADHTELAVEDCGPGIAPEDREVIFEPFHRLDRARARDEGGVGLGLHLCRQIAHAHGGTIVAEDRRDGGPGARLVFRVPLRG